MEQTFEKLFRDAYEATLGNGMSYDEVIKGKLRIFNESLVCSEAGMGSEGEVAERLVFEDIRDVSACFYCS